MLASLSLSTVAHSSRGVRRGDPFSPSLLILVTNVLSRMTCKLVELGVLDRIKCSPREKFVTVSHFQVADYTMFFLGPSLEKVHA